MIASSNCCGGLFLQGCVLYLEKAFEIYDYHRDFVFRNLSSIWLTDRFNYPKEIQYVKSFQMLPIRKALFTFLLLPFASCFFVLLPFDGFWYIVTTYGNCLDALDFFMQDSKLKKMMMGVSSVGFAAASFLSGKTRPKVPSQTLRVWPIHGHIQIWRY